MSLSITKNTQRDPFRSLTRELFGFDPFSGYSNASRSSSFTPNFEVLERDKEYLVRADLPGVAEDALDISLHKNILTVSGGRVAEERADDETYYLHERSFGSFARSFSLPEAADAEKIEARLADGVLQVSIAKRAESQPRKIALSK